MWQMYLPAPKYITRPKFDVSIPNRVHQADILFLPHDRKYKYALTVVDVALRYKDAEPLTSKNSAEVAKAFTNIYKLKLTWPKLLQVDPGREFIGDVNKLMELHNVEIRRGEKALYRSQGIVERLIGLKRKDYLDISMLKRFGKSTEWVQRLPQVIKAINNEPIRFIGMKPSEAIKKQASKMNLPRPQKTKMKRNYQMYLSDTCINRAN